MPTDIYFSFTRLAQRRGGTGPHKDGQGITFYEGKGCRTFKGPQPNSQSPITELVQDYPIRSCSVVAHIRQASREMVALGNTHPFTRELWGRNWIYAYNGQLKGYKSLRTGSFHLVGETNNEKAFCWLLHRLTEHYPRTPGNMLGVFKYITTLMGGLHEKGVFNVLLPDRCYVMTFCSTNLHWVTRRAPFGVARLLGQDVEIDLQRETTPNDIITVITTQLLTADETWHRVMPGEWTLFCLGERVI